MEFLFASNVFGDLLQRMQVQVPLFQVLVLFHVAVVGVVDQECGFAIEVLLGIAHQNDLVRDPVAESVRGNIAVHLAVPAPV